MVLLQGHIIGHVHHCMRNYVRRNITACPLFCFLCSSWVSPEHISSTVVLHRAILSFNQRLFRCTAVPPRNGRSRSSAPIRLKGLLERGAVYASFDRVSQIERKRVPAVLYFLDLPVIPRPHRHFKVYFKRNIHLLFCVRNFVVSRYIRQSQNLYMFTTAKFGFSG